MARKSVPQEQALVKVVADVSRQMGFKKTPDVFIYENQIPGTFTDLFPNSIAFSTAMRDTASPEQIKAAVGHELEHLHNFRHDITRGLLSVAAWGAAAALLVISGIIAATALGIAAVALGALAGILATDAIITRRGEYNADKAGARIAGKGAMMKVTKTVKTDDFAGISQALEDEKGVPLKWTKRIVKIAESERPSAAARVEKLEGNGVAHFER